MYTSCSRGKLSEAPREERQVATRSYAIEGYQGDSYTTECEGSVIVLGLASYYRRYVKGFTAIASPFHTLTKKEVVFHWTPECHESFTKLKHLFMTASITAFPDLTCPFGCTPTAHLRLGCHLGTGARRERKNHLLFLLSSVAGREELPSYQAGMSGNCMRNCQTASLLVGEQVRHLYGPLRSAISIAVKVHI